MLGIGGALNMTFLALNLSHYVNGAAQKHGEVSRHLFGGDAIDAITNGVHAAAWVSPPFQKLFDYTTVRLKTPVNRVDYDGRYFL